MNKGDNTIDSRDVIKRIEELHGELDDQPEDARDEDAAEELAELDALAEEAEGCADWKYGETLIHDSYFEQYAEQLAEDIGAINRDAEWPLNHIDWEAAAKALQQDYTSVSFGDETYWIRS